MLASELLRQPGQGGSVPEAQGRPQPEAVEPRPADPLVALLASVAEGDRAAFSSLYAATSDRLLGIAIKMLGVGDSNHTSEIRF